MQDQWRKEIDEVLEGKRRWCVVTGDCLDVLPVLPSGCVDAVVTDPPYGIGNRMQGGTWGTKQKYADFRRWDIAPPSDWLVTLCGRRKAIVWGGNYFALPPSRCWLAWDKQNAVPTMADVELAWTNLDRPSKRLSLPVGVHNWGHPTEKPLKLMNWCLNLIPDTESVLDPYCGSGTTGVACLQTGRRFIGIEIDPTYAAIARRRCEKAEREQRELLFPAIDAPRQQTIEDLLSE